MKSKYIICVIALLVVVSNAGRQVVWAGPPASTGNSSATIKGVVKFEGVAPKSKPINMAADPSCAKQHPMPISAPEILTDGSGLQNAIVFVADGLGDRSFEPPSQPVVIEQKGCMYQPHVIAMRANQKLEVVNDDPTTHNIHPQPANNREWNKAEPPGTRVEDTFTREEIAIPVKCNVHPWMHGYVAVFKHPYFVVTGKDGSFDLNGLPPGTYILKAWHEKLGTATQQVTVGANESKTVQFVFKSGQGS
jgi:plastocyanin